MRKRKFVATPEWSDRMPWEHATVLGIDASMTSTGWSLVQFWPYRRPVVHAYGNVRTEATGNVNLQDTIERGHLIFDGVLRVVRVYAETITIDRVAIECPIAPGFSKGMARVESGAVMASCCFNAVRVELPTVPITLYQPNTVKKTAANNGLAEKPEVKAKVFEWLGTEFRTNADVSDSIAAAITDMIKITGVPDDY